jgi:hypothetical protein
MQVNMKYDEYVKYDEYANYFVSLSQCTWNALPLRLPLVYCCGLGAASGVWTSSDSDAHTGSFGLNLDVQNTQFRADSGCVCVGLTWP